MQILLREAMDALTKFSFFLPVLTTLTRQVNKQHSFDISSQNLEFQIDTIWEKPHLELQTKDGEAVPVA